MSLKIQSVGRSEKKDILSMGQLFTWLPLVKMRFNSLSVIEWAGFDWCAQC